MRLLSVPLFLVALSFGAIAAEENNEPISKELTARLGNRIWSAPERRLVRATIYKMGRAGADSNTKSKKSNEKIRLRYATAKEVGTVAAPYWLPRGSLVRLQTNQGKLLFIAADIGGSVERRSAAKSLGRNRQQKAAPVLDFCAKQQLWPDFVTVDVYYYAGKVPFPELKRSEQGALFVYARKYFKKGT